MQHICPAYSSENCSVPQKCCFFSVSPKKKKKKTEKNNVQHIWLLLLIFLSVPHFITCCFSRTFSLSYCKWIVIDLFFQAMCHGSYLPLSECCFQLLVNGFCVVFFLFVFNVKHFCVWKLLWRPHQRLLYIMYDH